MHRNYATPRAERNADLSAASSRMQNPSDSIRRIETSCLINDSIR